MLTTPHGVVLNKNGDGSGATDLTTSYTSGTAINVRGASSLKVRLVATLGGTATGITFRILDTSPSANATITAGEFPVRFTRESDGVAGTERAFTATGVDTIVVNLGGAFEQVTIQAKGAGTIAAADIAIAEVTTGEGPR